MCLGVPAEIVSVNGITAVVESWGTRREVRIDDLADALLPGDFVIEHDGAIVRRVAPDAVDDTLILYEMILGEA